MNNRLHTTYKACHDKYVLDQEKNNSITQFMKEGYRIHGSFAAQTAQNIMNSSQGSSNDSTKSRNHHPQRTIFYEVLIPKQDSDDSELLKWMIRGVDVTDKLNEFRDRAVQCSRDGVNPLSDLRLLSLDYIYLFSRDGFLSISTYLDSDIQNLLFSEFGFNEYIETVDSVSKDWCEEVSDFTFSCNTDPYIELQSKTVSILGRAVESKKKSNIIIANMLHTIAGRVHLSSSLSNVEDTHIHQFVSYAIKHVFGMENILDHNWANGQLNDAQGFKPDYVAFTKKMAKSI
jgi:hypothetical protein